MARARYYTHHVIMNDNGIETVLSHDIQTYMYAIFFARGASEAFQKMNPNPNIEVYVCFIRGNNDLTETEESRELVI